MNVCESIEAKILARLWFLPILMEIGRKLAEVMERIL